MIIARDLRKLSGAPERLSKDAPRFLASGAVLIGIAAWVYYLGQDLVLSHYDAKAHLVVARRVFDSITPGWRQIGAVWLPLPHLINLFPTQIDLFYRTGAFASLVAIGCLGVTVWASARLIILATGSVLGATTTAALFALNPNLLYLHVTPMTEPLSIAATCLVVLWLYEWMTALNGLAIERNRPPSDRIPRKLGWALFAAAWTRYEAWAVVGAALVVAIYAMWRLGMPARAIASRAWKLTLWPAAAIVSFVVMSRLTTASWFVGSEFYVPDPYYEGQGWRTLMALWWGTHRLSGYAIEIVALVAAAILIVRALLRPRRAPLLLFVTFFASAAVPYVAFYQGHPYRMRYMVPLVAGCSILGGLAVGLASSAKAGRDRQGLYGPALAALLIGSAVIESSPWGTHAPLLAEAQWDLPNSHERRKVTACLDDYRGEKILISMASLAHYMQELSREQFRIADFVHEGNGSIWELALETGPAPLVGWMLVEEEAEEGDVLARRMRNDASFARGMTRICEGGGVALYRRTNHQSRISIRP